MWAAGCVAAVWPGVCAGQEPAANPSSHSAAFFSRLLTDRIWVARPAVALAAVTDMVWAAHFRADGSVVSCGVNGRVSVVRWRVSESVDNRAVLERFGTRPIGVDDETRRDTMFYDGETGCLHMETRVVGRRQAVWLPWSAGWVQETVPRVMADRCPEFGSVSGLGINERQTADSYDVLADQDPDAAVRKFVGWEFRGPGAHGRGWVGLQSGPEYRGGTLSEDELREFLVRRDGEVLVHNDGSRHVLVLRDAGDELWRLASDGSVEDVGHLTLSGDEIVLQYEHSNREERWDVDFALPLLPTGERYAAMRLGDWLASRPGPVVLPFHGVARVGFHFGIDGTAAATTVDGGEVGAAWQWSRGSLVVRVRGFERAAAYPWERLAAHVDWPGAPAR